MNNNAVTKVVAVAAVAFGLAAGSYGIASAAGSGSGSADSSTAAAADANAQAPWGHQRSDETVLSGDAASKVRAAALARVPGGTVIRVETDADGHAAYEAHMTNANGTPVTVYVNKSFNVVSVETR